MAGREYAYRIKICFGGRMSSKLQIGIIGLGKFGFSFGKSMVQLKQNVFGVDKDPEKIKRSQQVLTQVYQAEVLDQSVLMQLGFSDFTHVLVSVGNSITASSMIAMHLLEIGVKEVWVKAVSEEHQKLLNKIGVQNIIIPENMAAEQLANRLAMPGFIDYLPFDQHIVLKEIEIHKWAGKTLRNIDLTNQYSIQVIAFKKPQEAEFKYIPKADDALEEGDILIVIGHIDMLSKIKP